MSGKGEIYRYLTIYIPTLFNAVNMFLKPSLNLSKTIFKKNNLIIDFRKINSLPGCHEGTGTWGSAI